MNDRFSKLKEKTEPFLSHAFLNSSVIPVLFIFSLLYYYSYYDHGIIPNDEGHLLHFSERHYNGEVPGRDFHLETYIFGRYSVLAFLFHFFGGPNILIERAMWVVLRAVCALLVFLLAKKIMPLPYVWPVFLFVLILPGPWHKTPYSLSCLLGLYSIFIYLEHRTWPCLVLCGGVSSICLLLRQDIGLFILLVSSLSIFLSSLSKNLKAGDYPSFSKRLMSFAKHFSLYLVFTLLFLLPALLYLISNEALVPVLQQCFIEKVQQHLSLYNFFFRFQKMWDAGDVAGCLYFLLPPIIYSGILINLLFIVLSKKMAVQFFQLFALFLVAVLSINQAYNHALIIRLLQCSAPTCILAAYLSWQVSLYIFAKYLPLLDKGKKWTTLGVPSLVSLVFLLIAIEIISSNREANLGIEYRGSIATYNDENLEIQTQAGKVYAAPTKASLINNAVKYIKTNVSPDEHIFIACNDSILYFLSGRKNSSRFAKFFMPGEPEGRASLVAEELKNSPPRIIVSTIRLLNERKGHPAVKFIKNNYLPQKTIQTGYQKSYCFFLRKDS